MNLSSFSLPKLLASLLGILWASIEPTLPYAVILDMITAVRCNRRIRRLVPTATDGKLKSQHLSKLISDLAIVWLCMLLAENESTAKSSTWARILQKVIASKISRHTDVPEQGIIEIMKDKKKSE